MARWIIENNVKDFEELSGFNSDGYYYSKAESTATEPVFLRDYINPSFSQKDFSSSRSSNSPSDLFINAVSAVSVSL